MNLNKSKDIKVRIKETGEEITVYLLKTGSTFSDKYHDANAVGVNQKPTATKANKKIFDKSELIFL
jgi:hypothetical protein